MSLRSERGQTLTEYAVVLTVIGAGVVLAFGGLAGVVGSMITRAAAAF